MKNFKENTTDKNVQTEKGVLIFLYKEYSKKIKTEKDETMLDWYKSELNNVIDLMVSYFGIEKLGISRY